MIRALGNRLQALHIHDNDCWHDSHQIPFSMSIDFDAVVKALKDINYSGYFTLEASSYLEAFTPETTQKGLCDLAASAKDFPICLKHCKAPDPSYRFSRSASVFPAAAAVFIYPQAPFSLGARSPHIPVPASASDTSAPEMQRHGALQAQPAAAPSALSALLPASATRTCSRCIPPARTAAPYFFHSAVQSAGIHPGQFNQPANMRRQRLFHTAIRQNQTFPVIFIVLMFVNKFQRCHVVPSLRRFFCSHRNKSFPIFQAEHSKALF